MREKIISLLLHQEGYLSGEELSAILGISRAAIWKHIHAIRADGGVIEAHTNRGYRLTQLPNLLKPEYVHAYAPNTLPIHWQAETGSTNDDAKHAARQGAAECCFVAENQTGGRGRMGNTWASVPEQAVQMSLLLRPNFPPRNAPAVTFAISLGVCAAIESFCNVAARIKWPNDVVYQGKKLCGILTEMSADIDRVEYIVCGAGTNVNQTTFPGEIEHRATSLSQIVGKKLNRVEFFAVLLEKTHSYYLRYCSQGFAGIAEEYQQKSAVIGQQVVLHGTSDTEAGLCTGFDDTGAILVQTAQGTKAYFAGEVSLRTEKGYV